MVMVNGRLMVGSWKGLFRVIQESVTSTSSEA